jgi:hypothetical protein
MPPMKSIAVEPHERRVAVFGAEVPAWRVNKEAMREEILALLWSRLEAALSPYDALLRRYHDSLDHKKRWLRTVGTFIRLFHEIVAIEPRLFSLLRQIRIVSGAGGDTGLPPSGRART